MESRVESDRKELQRLTKAQLIDLVLQERHRWNDQVDKIRWYKRENEWLSKLIDQLNGVSALPSAASAPPGLVHPGISDTTLEASP